MTTKRFPISRPALRSLPRFTAALAALGLISSANAALNIAGTLLVDLNATTAPVGSISSITNNGTMGGYFEALGGVDATPRVLTPYGAGVNGIFFDGSDFLQHVSALGGPVLSADPSLTGANPSCTIEAWVLNPGLRQEETIVSWGHRGGPDGSNMSFNYGWDAAWGAVGHWGGPDIGWDPASAASGVNPLGNPTSGQWHHLVYTYDGTTQKVFSDGVLKNSEVVNLNIHAIPGVTIGAQLDNDTTVTADLRGRMVVAQLRIHSDALSDANVTANYNEEKSAYNNIGSPIPFHPTHRYSFNNGAGAATNGAVVIDSEGGANGNVRGAGANFTGTRVTIPGGPSSTQGYVDLPNGLLSVNSADNGGNGEVTIEGWVKVTGGRTWGRIFDFGSSLNAEVGGPGGGGEGTDYLFMSAQDGDNVNRHVVDIRNIDGLPNTDPAGPGYDSGNFNRDFHFALTWNESTGVITIYENGAAVDGFAFDASPATGTRISSINDVNVWLGRSNWTGDQNMQGEFDEFRIWNRVLTDAQLRASYLAGPDALATVDPASIVVQPLDLTVPEFGSGSFTASGQGAAPLGRQWYKNGAILPGQTGSTLNLSSIPYSENGAEFYFVASNNIGGTAYTATSRVATLTVIPDTTAPTLLLARLNSSNQIEVVFSEPVSSTDALNLANYALNGLGNPVLTSVASGGNSSSYVLNFTGDLTGCEFYTVTVSGIHDLSAAANVTTSGASATAWNLYLTGLTHRYNFNTTPAPNANGAVVPDFVGGANGVVLGGNGSLDGSKVVLGGGSSATAAYVDLPNGLLSVNSTNNGGSGKITLEGWVKVTGGRTWGRVFDFGDSLSAEVFGPGGGGEGKDYFMLSSQVGDDVNNRRIELRNENPGGGGVVTVDGPTAGYNNMVQFAVTWDEATGQIRSYENGNLVSSVTTDDAFSDINDVNVWLGRSNWTGDQNMQGEFDEFRVYNKILPVSEMRLNHAAGPDNNFGSLQGFQLSFTTNSVVTNTISQGRALAVFSNVGTQDVASIGCVVYSSVDSNIAYVSADGVLHAGVEGTTTVSAVLGGVTNAQVIEVTADATAPTVVGVRALGTRHIEITYSEAIDPGTGGEASNYQVASPSGTIEVVSAVVQPDPSRVVLTLLAPMPCEYMTVTINSVFDLSPLGNMIASDTQASFMHFVPRGLAHRYNFNGLNTGNANNVPLYDAAGTADGVVLGAGASFNGTRLVLAGGPSTTAGYGDLPNGLVSTNGRAVGGSGQISIEGWYKATGNRAWGRIFDIGDSASAEVLGPGGGGEGKDYFMLSAQNGGDVNTRRVELRNETPGGGGQFTMDHVTAGFGQTVHFVVTWDEATGQIRNYENGVQVSAMVVPTQLTDLNDVNVWLGRSNWTGDANAQGEFDEFRIYNHVLTPSEIAASASLGADMDLGRPLALRSSITNFLHQGEVVTPAANADFVNITNLDLIATGCAILESSNPAILAVDENGRVQAVGGGTADLTIRFSGFTNTFTIVVNAAPVGGDDGVITDVNTGVTLTVGSLLTNDTDPDGNLPLALTAVSSTSTNGATVTLVGNDVTYSPVAGFVGMDRFTYTLMDTLGAAVQVNVFVQITAGPVPALNNVGIVRSGGNYLVSFRGLPGTAYRIQRTTSLTAPVVWEDVGSFVVSPTGIISITDPAPTSGDAFYQVITP